MLDFHSTIKVIESIEGASFADDFDGIDVVSWCGDEVEVLLGLEIDADDGLVGNDWFGEESGGVTGFHEFL